MKISATLVLVAILAVVLFLPLSWAVMIAVGVLHAIFAWPGITISFVQGMQLTWVLSVFASFFTMKSVNSK